MSHLCDCCFSEGHRCANLLLFLSTTIAPHLYPPLSLRVSVSMCKSYGNKSENWKWSWKYVHETAPSPPTQPLLEFPLPSCPIMFKTRWRARTGAPDRCWPFLNPARSHKFKRLSNSLCSRDITEQRHLLSFWSTDRNTRNFVLWSSDQGRGILQFTKLILWFPLYIYFLAFIYFYIDFLFTLFFFLYQLFLILIQNKSLHKWELWFALLWSLLN